MRFGLLIQRNEVDCRKRSAFNLMVNQDRRRFIIACLGLSGVVGAVLLDPFASLRGPPDAPFDPEVAVENFLFQRHLPRSTWCRFWEGTARPSHEDYRDTVETVLALDQTHFEASVLLLVEADFKAGRTVHIDGWILSRTEAFLATALADKGAKACAGRAASLSHFSVLGA